MEYLIIEGIKGLRRVLENKTFTTSNKVEIELKEYNKINNPLLGFLEDYNIDDIINHTTGEPYLAYKTFCIENGMHPLSKIEFSRQVCKNLNIKVKVTTINNESVRVFVR